MSTIKKEEIFPDIDIITGKMREMASLFEKINEANNILKKYGFDIPFFINSSNSCEHTVKCNKCYDTGYMQIHGTLTTKKCPRKCEITNEEQPAKSLWGQPISYDQACKIAEKAKYNILGHYLKNSNDWVAKNGEINLKINLKFNVKL
jgi:hypothetical protein